MFCFYEDVLLSERWSGMFFVQCDHGRRREVRIGWTCTFVSRRAGGFLHADESHGCGAKGGERWWGFWAVIAVFVGPRSRTRCFFKESRFHKGIQWHGVLTSTAWLPGSLIELKQDWVISEEFRFQLLACDAFISKVRSCQMMKWRDPGMGERGV